MKHAMKRSVRTWWGWWKWVLPVLILAGMTRGAGAAEPRVRDDAGFFGRDAVRRADDTIAQIKQRFGKDLMVETFASIPTDLQERYRRDGKERFFEEWGRERGRALGLNGIEVLICREPARVEVTASTGSSLSGEMHRRSG